MLETRVELASAFTSAVQKEMQSLREELRAPFTAMQKEMQGLREHSQQLQADAVQQQRQTEDLQAQINDTKTVDLQQKLVSVKVDAVELNNVQLDTAKVHAEQLSDPLEWEKWLHTHIISKQGEMKGEIEALQTQVKDLNLDRQTQIDCNKDDCRRQHEVQNQMDELHQELRVLKEALSPPPPPTSAKPIASSGSSSPPQPPPLPPPPPQQPNPVARLFAIVDEPRRQCCPMCWSVTDGTTCPVKPLPDWSYMSDYGQNPS